MAALASSVSALLNDSKYADLEIRCDGKTFKVHRAIVCPRSKVLDIECSGGFLEADTRIINHNAFDADTLERMLQFIYRGGYSVNWTKDEGASRGTRWCRMETTEPQERDRATESSITDAISSTSSIQPQSTREPQAEDNTQEHSPSTDVLLQHVHVYAIADYYQLSDLQALALHCFKAEKSSLIPVINDRLIQIIEAIYKSTPSSDQCLRSEILAFCLDEKKILLEDDHFVQAIIDSPKLEEFTEEFILSLIHRQQEDLEDGQKSHFESVKKLQTNVGLLRQEVSDAQELVKSSGATADATTKQLKQVQNEVVRLTKENNEVHGLVKLSQATERDTAEQLRQTRNDLTRVTRERDQISQQLQSNATTLKDGAQQLLQAQDAIARGAREKDQVIQQLQATLAKLRSTLNDHSHKVAAQLFEFEAIRVCRHCGDDDFEYYLEREGYNYVARCEECTTRHYPSVTV